MCRRNGTTVCLPQPFHVCTAKCKFVEIKGLAQYVCAWSRNVHFCGEHCQCGERLKDNSADVCRLTGRILPHKILKHYNVPSKNDPKIGKHEHHVKMATGRKRRRKINSITHSPDRLAATVRKTVRVIMCGKIRTEIYKKAHQRFIRDVRTKFRSAFVAKQQIDFMEAYNILRNLRKHYARSLNVPVEMSEETVGMISTAICKYFVKIRTVSSADISDTVNSAEIFTACVLSKLASGFSLGGVAIIPKMFYFARHVPADIQFKELPNIRCRSMSVCTRAIQAACLTPSGRVRYDFRFSLDGCRNF